MGKSIHVHIEVRDGDTWHHYAAPWIEPNHKLYSLLNASKGLPKDLTLVTSRDYKQTRENNMGVNGESWLDAGEIANLAEGLTKACAGTGASPMEYDLDLAILHTLINDNAVQLHQGWDDVRLIYWYY